MTKLKYIDEGMLPVWDANTVEGIKTLMLKKYLAFLNDEAFEVDAGYNKHQVQVRVTLRNKDGSLLYPVEAVHIIEPESEQSTEEIGELMLDYLDVYWNEYLTTGRDVFVQMDWTKYVCEGIELFMRGFVRNSNLESEADALLARHGSGTYEIDPISSES